MLFLGRGRFSGFAAFRNGSWVSANQEVLVVPLRSSVIVMFMGGVSKS